MNKKGFSPIILLIIIGVLIVAGGAYYFTNKSTPAPTPEGATSTLPEAVTPTSTTTTTTSDVFPPNGWYVHSYLDIPALRTATMLTKEKTYPVGYCEGTEWACYGEQIGIWVSTTTLTAEAYITNIVQEVYPSTKNWGILNGHKIFSMTYVTDANTVPTDEQYLFVGNKIYQFSLYPSAEKDRNDFQQVVNYYAKNIGKGSSASPQNTDVHSSQLISFSGSSGVFSAQSYGLTSVKVYYYPTGSGVEQPKLLDSMNLRSTNTSGLQTWSLSAYGKMLNGSLSSDPILATSIYAVGYIGTKQQNKLDYPYVGASDIFSHLY